MLGEQYWLIVLSLSIFEGYLPQSEENAGKGNHESKLIAKLIHHRCFSRVIRSLIKLFIPLGTINNISIHQLQ